MNILIANDGSDAADAAISELKWAGLPEVGEATVISVAEVWLPPANVPNGKNGSTHLDESSEELIKKHHERGKKAVLEAESLARDAQSRLQKILPNWKVNFHATYGSPTWEILSKAEIIHPDLIVLGSHGRSAIGRLILGSVSQKVLTEARCSVRISRPKSEADNSELRIIIGFDGSQGAMLAVESVAKRNWPKNTQIRLLAVTDPVVPTAIGRFVPPVVNWAATEMRLEREWMTKISSSALDNLKSAGLKVELKVEIGSAKNVIIEEAANWNAESIFVGATSLEKKLERFLIGSTSSAIAARAECSVEVVRPSPKSL